MSAPDPDSHERPPDPAGTQPRVDRDALLPARIDRDRPPPPPPDESARALEPLAMEDAELVAAHERREPPYAARFQFLLGALLAVAVVGILGLVLAVGRSGGGTGGEDAVAWSSWRPTVGGLTGAQQIAQHVSSQYKLSTGEQMVFVEARTPEMAGRALEMVVRKPPQEGGQIERLRGDVMLYRVCGLERGCAIKGTPSQSRGLMLRRQLLELASYTFRYLPEVDRVAFTLPPTYEEVPATRTSRGRRIPVLNQIVVLSRSDVAPVLDAPLRTTLRTPPPPMRAMYKAPERTLVEALTTTRQFTFRLVEGEQEDAMFMVLEKLGTADIIRRQAAQNILEGAAPADATLDASGATATPPDR